MSPTQASLPENEKKVWLNLNAGIKPPSKKPKFKIGDKVSISTYKRKVFDKGYTPNWTEEVFVINEIQTTDPMAYELRGLNDEPIHGSFYGQE